MAEYIKTCLICGKTFLAINKQKIYCSFECRKKSNKNPYAEAKRVCVNCGAKTEDGRYRKCAKCMFEFYDKTKSKDIYSSLVKRGYGYMFTINDLMSRHKHLK